MAKKPTVLVVITRAKEADPLVGWAQHFARAKEAELCAVCPIVAPKPAPIERYAPDELRNDPLLEAIAAGADEAYGPLPSVELRRGPDALASVLAAVADHDTVLLVSGTARGKVGAFGALDQALMAQASCEVLLLRADAGSAATASRSIVPTAGGPHARAALRLAHSVAESLDDGELTALYVEQEAGADARALGEHLLADALKKAGLETSPRLQSKVVLGDRVSKAIGDAAHEGYHLVLIGASNLSLVRRMLFGSVPERLVRGSEGTAIGIMRGATPFFERARVYLGERIRNRIPQLTRDARIDLFRELQAGSELSFNFVTMISLSTAIAALGLTQNSAAVVIGAMLVAPLMTPMLGAGLALVQGNVVLIRRATVSIAIGAGLALATGFIFGWLAPIKDLTPELLARGQPNLLDLFIALFSGAAGAFATARPGLSGALPGVAIAAALVPPIATVGISLAYGEPRNAYGAAILFTTNLIAIILSAAFTLFILGVRANGQHTRGKIWVRRAIEALILATVLIAIPLGTRLLARVSSNDKVLQSALSQVLKGKKQELGAVRLAGPPGQPTRVTITVYSPTPVSNTLAKRLRKITARYLPKETPIRIVTLLRWEPSD
ncbi:MAG: TIGR00341 family protein [Deltaproteobacteria bacterium]|nr:TIGR00341 family protein [Deltaproteobacteria bacterium]